MRSICLAIFLVLTCLPAYSERVPEDQAKKVISKGKVLAFFVDKGRTPFTEKVTYDISYKGDIFRCTIRISSTISKYLKDEKKFEESISDFYVDLGCYDETPKILGN